MLIYVYTHACTHPCMNLSDALKGFGVYHVDCFILYVGYPPPTTR